MGIQTAVAALARLLDAYESGDRSVRHVGATTTGAGEGALAVELEVPVPLCRDRGPGVVETPVRAALSDDGSIAVEFPTEGITGFPSISDADVTTSPQSARVRDGEVLLTVEAIITPTDDAHQTRTADGGTGSETDNRRERGAARAGVGDGGDRHGTERNGGSVASTGPGSDGHPDTPSRVEAARNEAVPPYEDIEYLRAIYERFDTFSEMREAIEMDVSTETVRRYMIDAGIHDPASYQTAVGSAAGSPSGRDTDDSNPVEPSSAGETDDPACTIPDEQLVTDGIGLPEDLALEDVLDAVVESSTVYEVTRTLQLDQRRTREILEQLDLLDLVMHRVSDDRCRDLTYEEVAERLRRSAASP